MLYKGSPVLACLNLDVPCGLWQGCIYQVDVRRDPAGYELLPTLLGDMIAAGLRPNKATHALFCEAYLMEELGEVCKLTGITARFIIRLQTQGCSRLWASNAIGFAHLTVS
jgi:hypothetical protein